MRYDKEFDVWAIIYSSCIAELGITRYAAKQIGEIAYINFAVKPGNEVKRGDVLAYIESPKTCAEVKSPFDSEIRKVFDNSIGEMCQQMNEDAEEVALVLVCADNGAADVTCMVSEEEYMEGKK